MPDPFEAVELCTACFTGRCIVVGPEVCTGCKCTHSERDFMRQEDQLDTAPHWSGWLHGWSGKLAP